MNEVLEETITGAEPVTVTLGGKDYALAFPLHACALYQRETARLDRARRVAHGALTPELRKELKERRRQLLRQADEAQAEIAAAAAPEKENDRALTPEERALIADKTEGFYEFLSDAMAVKNRLDEDAGRGDSLFLEGNWFKITSDDPDRVVLALWAGLHQPPAGPDQATSWTAPFTVDQLRKLVDPANAEEVIEAISKALRVYSVKKKQTQVARNPGANGSGTTTRTNPIPLEFPSSGPSPESTSDSPNSSS